MKSEETFPTPPVLETDGGYVPAEAMLFCPVCNDSLVPHKCKLLCQRCGYYMSCADYY